MQNTVNILYFASLAESLSCKEECLPLPAHIQNLKDLSRHLSSRGSPWDQLQSSTILYAVNQEMVKPDHRVSPGDEIAFFPPVTGG